MFQTDKNKAGFIFLILIFFNVWVWYGVLNFSNNKNAIFFLDIGQGDSELITLFSKDKKSEMKILIDAGKDKKVLDALDSAFGRSNDKYIDLAIMTHPDLDHFGGFLDVAQRYNIGLFISNGQSVDSNYFLELQKIISERGIPTLVLKEGDKIKYEKNLISIISPDKKLLQNKVKNEAGLVIMAEFKSENINTSKVIFTADIGRFAENILLGKKYDLSADILKVGHHGSKNSSSEFFISAINPALSVIEVGKNNYGHPTEQVLKTLENVGSEIRRTDKDGTIKVVLNDDFSLKSEKKDGVFLRVLANVFTGAYRSFQVLTFSLNDIKKEKEIKPKTQNKTYLGKKCLFGQININIASKSELMTISHIGSSRADDIIKNRPFFDVSAIKGIVAGIGDARIQDIISENKACAD